jgi:hypothetical protein
MLVVLIAAEISFIVDVLRAGDWYARILPVFVGGLLLAGWLRDAHEESVS